MLLEDSQRSCSRLSFSFFSISLLSYLVSFETIEQSTLTASSLGPNVLSSSLVAATSRIVHIAAYPRVNYTVEDIAYFPLSVH